MQLNLRQFFTPAAVAQTLSKLPKVETFIMDEIYPDRRTHPMPVLGTDELNNVVTNVPVVRRGTEAFVLSGASKNLSYMEPQPVDVSSFLSASDLNNLKVLGTQGIEFWRNQKIDDQRRAVRATTEALACQSISGKISYPMKTDGGALETYEVDFGAPISHSIAMTFDDVDASVASVLKTLITMGKLIKRKSGYGSRIKYLAGEDVYIALANLVLSMGESNIKAAVTENGISLAGFTVKLAQGGYTNLTDKTFVPAVGDKDLVAIAVDAPFRIFYCAIDDLDAGLLPMPFYSKPIKKDNPSGYEILGKSKPLPVPVVNAICKTQAVN